MTIGKKLFSSFAAVLVLLAVVGIVGYEGIVFLNESAVHLDQRSSLAQNMAQKEIDHLNWVNKVTELLNNEKITTLDVQTDDRLCAFGQWLYGEGREQAVAMVPSLAPILSKIEDPHRRLHQTAIKISADFKQANIQLGEIIQAKKSDHLA